MKITDIETFRLVTPIEKPFAWSQYWTNIRTVGIVKITTDEGIIGSVSYTHLTLPTNREV